MVEIFFGIILQPSAAAHSTPSKTAAKRSAASSTPATTDASPTTGLAVSTCHSRPGRHQIRNPLLRCAATGLTSATVAGPDLGIASAYATAAVAMGPAALDWLASLEGCTYLITDDDGPSHGDTRGPHQG